MSKMRCFHSPLLLLETLSPVLSRFLVLSSDSTQLSQRERRPVATHRVPRKGRVRGEGRVEMARKCGNGERKAEWNRGLAGSQRGSLAPVGSGRRPPVPQSDRHGSKTCDLAKT